MDEFMDYEKQDKSQSNKKWGILAVILVLVVVVAGVYYSTVLTNTINVYRRVVTGTVDNAFETINPTNEAKTSIDITLDIDMDLVDDEFEASPLMKLLKDAALALNVQTDIAANKSALHIKSKYENENLLDAAIFMDHTTSKAYVYAKDILENYIEVDMATEEEETTTNTEEYVADPIAIAKAEKILKAELSNVITEDMCYKKDGAYVLKTNNIQLVENLKKAIENLKLNQEFLNCYENPEDIKETLDIFDKALDTETMDKYEIEITLEMGLFLDFKNLTAKVWDDTNEVLLAITENTVAVNVKEDNEEMGKCNLEVVTTDDTTISKVSLDVAEIGKWTVESKITAREVDSIDVMPTSNVKKMDDLTMFDMMYIADKFSKTKLGEVVQEINEYNNKKILDAANQAIEKTNLSQAESLASLTWSEGYMDGKRGEELKNYVLIEMAEYTDEYDILVTDTGVSVTAKKAMSSSNDDIIEKAQNAITMTDVSTLNDKLMLAYVDLKTENPTVSDFAKTTEINCFGKKYENLEEYYKYVVPEIDESSSKYFVPEGYEVVFNTNGVAKVQEKTTPGLSGGITISY